MSRERVVVVTTSFPRHADDAAGHFVEADARVLSDRGHEVHVVCAGDSWRRPPERRGGLTIHWAGGGGLFRWPGALARLRQGPWRAPQLLSFAAGVRRRLRQLGRVDHVVAHWLVPSAWPVLLAFPAPLTVVAHGADVRLMCALPGSVRRHIVDSLLGRRASFRFVAAALQDQLLSALEPRQATAVATCSRIEPCPIVVPPKGTVATAPTCAGRWASPPSNGEGLAAVVGRLVPDKRVDLAIRSVAQLATPPHLLVIGDGPERDELQQLARRLGVAATFLGQQPRGDCLQAIASADVLLHCSSVEAAPSVIREARAYGVPVVATVAGDVSRWAAADPNIITAAPHAPALAAALQIALKRRNHAPGLQNEAARGTNAPC
ncbi:MAG: glycosyltransferase family 4 protein [Deltaproteobacteria bacterium]|nr:glycosyltransferase family 4 protein [Deltaproteobacteria bacterium]